jgi:hypothetical protein
MLLLRVQTECSGRTRGPTATTSASSPTARAVRLL